MPEDNTNFRLGLHCYGGGGTWMPDGKRHIEQPMLQHALYGHALKFKCYGAEEAKFVFGIPRMACCGHFPADEKCLRPARSRASGHPFDPVARLRGAIKPRSWPGNVFAE